MFLALDESGHRVSISDTQPGQSYFCDLCGKKLILKKKGKNRAPHFAHPHGSDCADWGDMSEWHLDWQAQFPVHTREVVLEKDGERHRADVCLQERRLVIEFQHSPISQEDFERRCLFYTGCGYQLVWVFDATGKLNGLKNFESSFLSFADLTWKRVNATFSNFSNIAQTCYPGISVFLETPLDLCNDDRILISVKDMNQKFITPRPTCQYLLRENFLREYGCIADNTIPSIQEILSQTKQLWDTYQKDLKKRLDEQRRQEQELAFRLLPYLARGRRRF